MELKQKFVFLKPDSCFILTAHMNRHLEERAFDGLQRPDVTRTEQELWTHESWTQMKGPVKVTSHPKQEETESCQHVFFKNLSMQILIYLFYLFYFILFDLTSW